jgi:hypothetical protein
MNSGTYGYIPPEIITLKLMLSNKANLFNEHDKEMFKMVDLIDKTEVTYYNQFIKNQIKRELLLTDLDKWDIFSLGIIMKTIMNINKIDDLNLKILINNMTDVDYKKRPNIRECLNNLYFL